MSDRLSSEVSVADGQVVCRVFPAEELDETDVSRLLGDLRNEVLDQVLRERIRTETADVRNLVFALAFSQTGLSEG